MEEKFCAVNFILASYAELRLNAESSFNVSVHMWLHFRLRYGSKNGGIRYIFGGSGFHWIHKERKQAGIDIWRFIASDRITISMIQFYEVELYYYYPNEKGIKSCLII